MQYTIHRALSMIKTTKVRIEKEIYDENTAWVRVARGQDDNISGVSIKEIKRIFSPAMTKLLHSLKITLN